MEKQAMSHLLPTSNLQMEKRARVISECTVLPATYQASSVPRRIALTPFDLQYLTVPNTTIQIVLVFSADLELDFLQRLKKSLSRTLDFFYPLAGRMCSSEDVSKDSALFYIDCNNAGVEFTHAAADITIPDLLQPVDRPEIMRLLFVSRGNKCDADPPLAVHVTELAKGGFVLSCEMSHVFGDGTSIWHFLNCWSEICCGCHSPKNLPVLERNHPGQTEIWIPNGCFVKPPSIEDTIITLVTLKERIFDIPKGKVALLKQKVIEETGIQNISSLQALVGFLWKIICRYRQVQDEDELILVMMIGFRTKITDPPSSAYYFGNAVYPAMTTMKVKDLRALDALGRAASKVHDLVISQSEDTIRDYITYRTKKLNTKKLGNPSLGSNTLYVGGSPKFNFYGNDFGWGKPMAVKTGPVSDLDGKILFIGGENGSYRMQICLPIGTMNHLENDYEFLDFLKCVYQSRL